MKSYKNSLIQITRQNKLISYHHDNHTVMLNSLKSHLSWYSGTETEATLKGLDHRLNGEIMLSTEIMVMNMQPN